MVNQDTVSLGIIILYMTFTVILGAYFYNKESDIEDYFLSNRDVGWIFLSLTMVASMQSAFALIGAAGIYYSTGIGFISLMLSQAWIAFMVIFFGYRLWLLGKKYRYLTLHEWFEHRYDSKFVKWVAAFITFWMGFSYMVAQFVGAGQAIAGLAGNAVSYQGALLLVAIFTGTYIVLGGMKGVIYTDAIQAILLLTTMVVILLISITPLGPIGGIGALFSGIVTSQPALLSLPGPTGSYTPVNWMMSWVILPFGLFLLPVVWVRILSARNERALAASGIAIPLSQILLYGFGGLLAGLGGWIAFGQIDAPDQIIPMLLDESLPWWLAAMLIAGVVAAARSTIDSSILVLTQILENDFLTDVVDLDPRQRSWVSRGAVAGMTLLAVVAALYPPDLLFNIILDITYVGLAMIIPAFLGALYWREASAWGAIASMVGGISIAFLGVLSDGQMLSPFPNDLLAFGIAFILFIVVSLFTTTSEQAVEETLGYIESYRQAEESVTSPSPSDD